MKILELRPTKNFKVFWVYWLQYILNFTPFENLKYLVNEKILAIEGFTLLIKGFSLLWCYFRYPLALLETLFQINDSQSYFFLRHKMNFIVFFIGSVFCTNC